MSTLGRGVRRAGAIALVVTAITAPIYAQGSGRSVLRGTLTADSGRALVADAEVALIEASRTTRSDSSGRFYLGTLASGTYTVRIRHLSWKPVEGRVTIADADTVDMRVGMVPRGTALPQVEIVENVTPPGLRDFERRRKTTQGKFMTADEIHASGAQALTSLIAGKIGGFEIVPLLQGGHAIATRRTGASLFRKSIQGNTCFTQVWLDGQLIFYPKAEEPMSPPRIEDFDLDKISAVEFYRPSQVPPELSGPGGGCGTAVIWMAVPQRSKP